METALTVVIVPRDRFSSLAACVDSILKYTPKPFNLVLLDLGFSAKDLEQVRQMCAGLPLEIETMGPTIPVVAFQRYLPKLKTKYTAWVDSDTYVTAGWMEMLLARAAKGARVIMPLTLERSGLDVDARKIPLRNHISHSEIRKVTVGGKEYIFDHKPYRRATPEEIPQEGHTIDFFELHAFFAETEVLRMLDYPPMVVREHIDMGIQLHKLGIPIWCEPKSVVHFDNIHERPTREDLKFFVYRWQAPFVNQSHELFRQRWGCTFYNEQFMCNWAFRRKIYSYCRFFGLPQYPSDFASRVANRFFCPPLPKELRHDPLKESQRMLA